MRKGGAKSPAKPAVHPERPITTRDEDALDRHSFVRRLSHSLVSTKTGRSSSVVIGLTGPWGSGKSSLLNLLQEDLKSLYANAIVVRFDPWLVSGRNDLIKEFLGDLFAEINKSTGQTEQLKKVASALLNYGVRLSPLIEQIPHIGKVGGNLLKAAKSALEQTESLSSLRGKMLKALLGLKNPIVVLIDELDRVEDEEIRTVAQLVRSVADFPGISYVLAYDATRVAEALGRGQIDKGQAYLEKIVQLQIPLPITLAEELTHLLRSELNSIREAPIPVVFSDIPRYQDTERLLVTEVLETFRDVKRLVGTFHATFGLVRGEADWIDVLAYTALLTKAPDVVDVIRKNPESVVDDPLSMLESLQRSKVDRSKMSKLPLPILGANQERKGIRKLLEQLFPALTGRHGNEQYPDPMFHRKTLLTVLRLGLVPGVWTRDAVRTVLIRPRNEIASELAAIRSENNFGGFIDRLDDCYGEMQGLDSVNMWAGVSSFLNRSEESWVREYVPMVWDTEAFASLMLNWCSKKRELRDVARIVFLELRAQKELALCSHWLHSHAFVYGLFGRDPRKGERFFLTEEQTKEETIKAATEWRREHLDGTLLQRSWDLFPLFVVQGAGLWDADCVAALGTSLDRNSAAVDAFTLMLFGPDYSTELAIVERFIDRELYLRLVKERLGARGADAPSESAVRALRRAREMIDSDHQ